ncbi:hypothetical protein A2701_02730 [Candidatus Amesbacteria bacterium RIFCSPHIGHO2_01_FULL_47_34]|uniref:DUF4190 domain-containing protein n=2 Tax=Candidatus Amesiibacteriota TaxID=1752730 RepID=A0A1F4ZVD6_9BACT|nr:MAG: hypothetical protein A2701_02730 [Candidatus Amesbacteria bacterium RIFCSPHIGHO2_01_FULL_47_34]OGD00546.1 MAG: hypothetical protein A2972_01575 [Candidatus Amesbacteria bacterium RIFCSPLOWO2_01_FULL_47_33]OGD10058.1 MAG: hypothetical protein A2395_00190 [Candidatus Amesbacteria bacterium RIFOXYB1_FULL_47_9]
MGAEQKPEIKQAEQKIPEPTAEEKRLFRERNLFLALGIISASLIPLYSMLFGIGAGIQHYRGTGIKDKRVEAGKKE